MQETQCTRHTNGRDEAKDVTYRQSVNTIKFRWDVENDRADNEIQVGSDSEPGSSKFISFSLLIGKFSHFH